MKRYLLFLAFALSACMTMPALASKDHDALANSGNGDVTRGHNTFEATSGTTAWILLGRLLWNTTAKNAQPAAMYMGSGFTSGYAISAKTCELLGRDSQLFKHGLDTGEYISGDLSKASMTRHAKKAGIAEYTPAFWIIATSRLVATNPANVGVSAQQMGEKVYGLCMHKFLGKEISYE